MKAVAISNRGFTLVEVLVALVCMAIGFVAMWGLHLSSYRVTTRNNHEARALRYANDAVENVLWVADNCMSHKTQTTCNADVSGRCMWTGAECFITNTSDDWCDNAQTEAAISCTDAHFSNSERYRREVVVTTPASTGPGVITDLVRDATVTVNWQERHTSALGRRSIIEQTIRVDTFLSHH